MNLLAFYSLAVYLLAVADKRARGSMSCRFCTSTERGPDHMLGSGSWRSTRRGAGPYGGGPGGVVPPLCWYRTALGDDLDRLLGDAFVDCSEISVVSHYTSLIEYH